MSRLPPPLRSPMLSKEFVMDPSDSELDRLSSVPPELLLRIISYLPSSTSFLPLVQTSRTLRLFFHLNAARICNSFILSRFPNEAAIMKSVNTGNWLTPTHRCVKKEEEKLWARQVDHCRACRAKVYENGLGMVMRDVDVGQLDTVQNFSPNPLPRRGSNPICVGDHVPELRLKLSAPGPQYLQFLEEYGFEIRVRWEMEMNLETGSADALEMREREERFDFMVGRYAVRRYLERAEQVMGGSAASRSGLAESVGQGKRRVRMKCGLRSGVWQGIAKVIGATRSDPKTGFREVTFESRNHDEVAKTEDNTARGLLWYYRRNEDMNLSHVMKEMAEENERETTNQAPTWQGWTRRGRRIIKRFGIGVTTAVDLSAVRVIGSFGCSAKRFQALE